MQGNIRLKILCLPNPQWCAKRAKPNTSQNKADEITYKDLNVFVNAKSKEKEVELNASVKFCSLNVDSSNEEDEPNKHAPVDVDNNDSYASCPLSDSNVE
eukprot:11700542-Ditylum_brightwellii.AAC.1